MTDDFIAWELFFNSLKNNRLSIEEIIEFLNTNVTKACYGSYFCSQGNGNLKSLYELEDELIETVLEACDPDDRDVYQEVIHIVNEDIYLKRLGRYDYSGDIIITTNFFQVAKFIETREYYA